MVTLNPRIDAPFVEKVFAQGQRTYEFVMFIAGVAHGTRLALVMVFVHNTSRAAKRFIHTTAAGRRRCDRGDFRVRGRKFFVIRCIWVSVEHDVHAIIVEKTVDDVFDLWT